MQHKMKELIEKLNHFRDEYYNNNESIVSDEEYDALFDELQELEKQTGIVYSNSPTCSVGYDVVGTLTKSTHENPPMLSLDKSKNLEDMVKFLNNHVGCCMAKMDGLTCRLTYHNGNLTKAETRGDGLVGEDITHNAYVIKNIPNKINIAGKAVIDGELIVRKDVFEKLKLSFVDPKTNKTYKNARNYASGSARLHSAKSCAKRELEFVAWKFVSGASSNSFNNRLAQLHELGFTVTPRVYIDAEATVTNYKTAVEYIQLVSNDNNYPIDGCVFSFDDCDYMEALGYTSHHAKSQLAYKFYDDLYDTTIRSIDWTMGKTGVLTPTAVFDTVEIDGTDVSRASLHNLTIMRELGVTKNCSAKVYKANMIIPQVSFVEPDPDGEPFEIPKCCPICQGLVTETTANQSTVLMCMNDDCSGKLLGHLSTFVSKQCFNIDGLGENTLSRFIMYGWLKNFADIFKLKQYYDILRHLDGWTDVSANKLLDSIEKSKKIKAENFLAALSIPNVGVTTAKTIVTTYRDRYGSDNLIETISDAYSNIGVSDKYLRVPGIAATSEVHLVRWFRNHKELLGELLELVTIEAEEAPITSSNSKISGRTFCITGKFSCSRAELQSKLESLGGIAVNGVTKQTDVLFVGDKAGSKLKKAQDLNIIIVEEDKLDSWLEDVC